MLAPTLPGKIMAFPTLMVLTYAALILPVSNADFSKFGEYCQWETFKAECGQGEVIVMRSATYGRMEYGRCIERDYGYIGCSTDVLRLADARCSGRRTCEIRIPDEAFDATRPCPKDLRRYLKAEYDCIKVASKTTMECQRSTHALLTDTTGFIGSSVTEETGCGTTETPWKVRAEPGQRLNFTLFDFATANNSLNGEGELGRGFAHCHVYVILKELEAGRSVTTCGGQERIKQIYTSTSNVVEIRVLTGVSSKSRYFVIKYEAWGCPDVVTPKHGWVKQKGARATVGCETSGETWDVTCNGTVWLGQVPICEPDLSRSLVIGSVTVPYTISLLIIVGVALMIGVCILTVGLLCLRRQRVLRRGRRGPGGATKTVNNDPYQKVNVDPLEHSPPYITQQETSENEYAYVDEFLPPPPPPVTGTGTGKMGSHHNADGTCTSGRGRYDYHNGHNRGNLPKIPTTCGHPFCSPSGPCEECREGRHYFELDPDVSTSCSTGSTVYTHAHSQPLLSQDILPYPGYERHHEQGTV